MITLLSLVLLGFFLGMRHAADPDHVVAVATIVSRQRRVTSAAMIGCAWGLGHTLTILVVGGAIVLFGVVIPPRLGLGMELGVAITLVALGLLNLRGTMRWLREAITAAGAAERRPHSHMHAHGDYAHRHPHGHAPGEHGHREEDTPQAWLDSHLGRLGAYRVLRPLIVGIVHGLAGSAAVALLVLGAIPHPGWALAYLLVFGLGTIAGMLVITVGVAAPVAFAPPHVHRYVTLAAGVVSVVFGLLLAYQITIAGGLFTDARPD